MLVFSGSEETKFQLGLDGVSTKLPWGDEVVALSSKCALRGYGSPAQSGKSPFDEACFVRDGDEPTGGAGPHFGNARLARVQH